MEHFRKIGTVIETRGSFVSGRCNSIALKYENRIQAEKAASQNPLDVIPGLTCGVQRLDDNDPMIVRNTTDQWGEIWGETSVKRTLATSSKDGITERDLLIHESSESEGVKKRNCLERFLCWVFKIDP